MNVFFDSYLTISLQLSPLIILVFLFKRFLSEKYGFHFIVKIYLILGLRLILPTFIIPISNMFQETAIPYFPNATTIIPQIITHSTNALPPLETNIPNAKIEVAFNFQIIETIWVIGFLAILAYVLILHAYFCIHIKKRGQIVNHTTIMAAIEGSGMTSSVGNKIAVVTCFAVSTPFLLGIFRPTIVLPHSALGNPNLNIILHHEVIHYKNKDNFIKLALIIALCIHWYNPFVWLLFYASQSSIEYACDESILKNRDKEYCYRYATTLLEFTQKKANHSTNLLHYYGAKKKNIYRRIELIMSNKTKRSGALALSLSAVAIFCSGIYFTNSNGTTPIASSEVYDNPSNNAENMGNPQIDTSSEVNLQNEPDRTNIEPVSMAELEASYKSNSSEINSQMQAAEEQISSIYDYDVEFIDESETLADPAWPVPSCTTVVSDYSWRFDNMNFHTGLSISDDDIYGEPVVSIYDGTVLETIEDLDGLMGLAIVIEHDGGVSSVYQNLLKIEVEKGDSVEKGQMIGNVGNTGKVNGALLEFQIRENGIDVDPFLYLIDCF